MKDITLPDAFNVPNVNLVAYAYLFEIETGLRELIIERLSAAAGPKWFKQRLNQPMLEKHKSAMTYFRKVAWRQFIPYHLMYYLDFPNLREIIGRDDNWRDAFRDIFGQKDIVVATLAELEPIRNNVAHNRRISLADLDIVRVAHSKITKAIGQSYFDALTHKATSVTDLPDRLNSLRDEMVRSYDRAKVCQVVSPLVAWPDADKSWWFDDDFLQHDVQAIRNYFALIDAYSHFSRGRGTGHLLEGWTKENSLQAHFDAGYDEISHLISMRP